MKILYLMHIDWGWIKQRPQFMAEYLAKNGVSIDLCCRSTVEPNAQYEYKNINFIKIPSLKGKRFLIIQFINKLLYKCFVFSKLHKNKYDYVYITHPVMYTNSIKSKLIYDCMDDCLGFNMSDKEKKKYFHIENLIARNAKLIVFSADYLSSVVRKRCKHEIKKYIVLNNAIEIPSLKPKLQVNIKKEKIICTYIGTISEWFDFDTLKKVSDMMNKSIVFYLYGPFSFDIESFDKDTFIFKGTISHEKIFDVMNESDILIMPFIVTELIKSVNPVKLYEYIYSGKPVISVGYGETKKFEDAVYLYDNQNENSLYNVIKTIENNNFKGKLAIDEAENFVKNNTWEERVRKLIEVLEC